MNKSVYENYSETKLKKAFDFCEGYKKFITDAKTEREAVVETIKIAEKNENVQEQKLQEIINENKPVSAETRAVFSTFMKQLHIS